MKKVLFLTMVLLIGVGISNAQDFETIVNFKLVAYNDKEMYLVNTKDAKIDVFSIVFTGMKANIVEIPGIKDAITPDKENNEFVVFAGNCETFQYSPTRVYGKKEGKVYKYSLKPEILTAKPGTVIYEFIDEVCLDKVGEQLERKPKNNLKM